MKMERRSFPKMKNLSILHNQLPLLAMIFMQIAYAGMFLLSKAAISSGLKPAVLVVYRQGIGALVLAPFAYFFDRKSAPLTWSLLGQIFIASTLGLSLAMNLSFAAFEYASATYLNALLTLVPLLVFVIAVTCRMEKCTISQWSGQAKILSLVLGLAGAAIFSLYKGPPLYSEHQQFNVIARSYTKEQTIKGCLMGVAAFLALAIWVIMQGPIQKKYNATFRSMTLQYFLSSVTAAIYGVAVDRNVSSWKLGWNMQLLSILYNGIILTGIVYTLQAWVVGKRGPLYTVIFNPLSLILTAIVSAVVFHETLHVGSILGSFMLIVGLYSFLWAKKGEIEQQKIETSKEEAQLESIVTSNECQSFTSETSDRDTDRQLDPTRSKITS